MGSYLKAMDLFAGCGGLSLGLESTGVKVQWANEHNQHACETYRNNHPNTHLVEGDANELLDRMLDGAKELPKRGDVDLLCGGPPCQGFSGFNRYRKRTDPRNSLLETFLGFVDFLLPPIVLLENVTGLLSMDNGSVAKSMVSSFEELGYKTQIGILQAGNFGLPQNRWRVFLWAVRKTVELPDYPAPTHSFPKTGIMGIGRFRDAVIAPDSSEATLFGKLLPQTTVGDAIGDLPPIENGLGVELTEYTSEPQSEYQARLRSGAVSLFDHQAAKLTGIQMERCAAVPKRPGAGWLDLPEALKPLNLLRHGDNRYPNRFGRLHWDGIFNTILSRPHPYWSCVFHPEQDRLISVRECARAQGFPDTFRFSGPKSSKYLQIGNAVPPILAAALIGEVASTRSR